MPRSKAVGAGSSSRLCAAADHGAAHEHRIDRLLQFGGRGVQHRGALLHRIGLTGEQPLVDKEIARLDHATIGRDAVASGQQHHIARHQRHHGHGAGRPVAHHLGAQRHRCAQLPGGAVRAVLQREIQCHAQQHHRQDDEEVHHIVRGSGDGADHQQREHQGIAEPRRELQGKGPAAVLLQLVGPVAPEPFNGLRLGQALRGRWLGAAPPDRGVGGGGGRRSGCHAGSETVSRRRTRR
jgi:hypothetical protein